MITLNSIYLKTKRKYECDVTSARWRLYNFTGQGRYYINYWDSEYFTRIKYHNYVTTRDTGFTLHIRILI